MNQKKREKLGRSLMRTQVTGHIAVYISRPLYATSMGPCNRICNFGGFGGQPCQQHVLLHTVPYVQLHCLNLDKVESTWFLRCCELYTPSTGHPYPGWNDDRSRTASFRTVLPWPSAMVEFRSYQEPDSNAAQIVNAKPYTTPNCRRQ